MHQREIVRVHCVCGCEKILNADMVFFTEEEVISIEKSLRVEC